MLFMFLMVSSALGLLELELELEDDIIWGDEEDIAWEVEIFCFLYSFLHTIT